MLTIFLVCRPYFWYVDHISGMLIIFLVCWPYFQYVDYISGMLIIFLVCWPFFQYVDHISGMLTIFLVCWPFLWLLLSKVNVGEFAQFTLSSWCLVSTNIIDKTCKTCKDKYKVLQRHKKMPFFKQKMPFFKRFKAQGYQMQHFFCYWTVF